MTTKIKNMTKVTEFTFLLRFTNKECAENRIRKRLELEPLIRSNKLKSCGHGSKIREERIPKIWRKEKQIEKDPKTCTI